MAAIVVMVEALRGDIIEMGYHFCNIVEITRARIVIDCGFVNPFSSRLWFLPWDANAVTVLEELRQNAVRRHARL